MFDLGSGSDAARKGLPASKAAASCWGLAPDSPSFVNKAPLKPRDVWHRSMTRQLLPSLASAKFESSSPSFLEPPADDAF